MTASNAKIPDWVFNCLDQYGNCACGRRIVESNGGKDNLLKTLEEKGYKCDLEILADPKDTDENPKDGTYILQLQFDEDELLN